MLPVIALTNPNMFSYVVVIPSRCFYFQGYNKISANCFIDIAFYLYFFRKKYFCSLFAIGFDYLFLKSFDLVLHLQAEVVPP